MKRFWSEVVMLIVIVVLTSRLVMVGRYVSVLESTAQSTSSMVAAIAHRRSSLEQENRYLHQLMSRSRLDSTVVMAGMTLASEAVHIQLNSLERPTMFFTVDPDCPACIRTLPFVQEMFALQECRPDVIGVAVDGFAVLPQFQQDHSVEFPIIEEVSSDIRQLLPFTTSPAIVAVAPGGKLLGWWLGELSFADQQQVRDKVESSCPY